MHVWATTLASTVASLLAAGAMAQSWPAKPIRLYIGYNAGTSPDLLARIVGPEMTRHLGQPIIVENRPGAAGSLATTAASRAEPDGYSLALGSQTSSHPIFDKSNGFILGKDLSALGTVAMTPAVLFVRSSLGVKNLQELVAYSKANPDKLNFGSTTNHFELMLAQIKLKTGLSYTTVPYKGAPVAELLRGEADFYVGSFSGLAPHIQAGKIAPILIMSKESAYPNVPNAVEMGLMSAPYRGNFGYVGPVALPREVIRRVNDAMLAATRSPEIIDGIKKIGLEVYYTTPEQHLQEYEAVVAQFVEVIRATNFAPR